MREIELEEGETCLFQDDYDDDENIDPDKDFSYIDKKLEDILGHHQKEFMGGLSAENLGARFGGYGSFLPMQQRSPPILPNQRSQNYVNSKSPQDMPSEHIHQNPTTTSKSSLPIRSIPASGEQIEEASESGTSLMNNQSKFQSSGVVVSNCQSKKPLKNLCKSTSLKFRVKMASEIISSLDKSAIYNGLGLVMSPSSSPEGSPSENDQLETGLQEMNLESPSTILRIMTTLPIPKKDLLSPLHDSFVSLRGMESNLNASLLGTGEVDPAIVSHESIFSKGKKEARKERKAKVKDASKVKKSKHKGASEEKKSKKIISSHKPVKLMESCEYPATFVTLSANRRDDNGASTVKEVAFNASFNAVGAYSEENERGSLMSKSISSKPSTVFDKRTVAGCLSEDIGNPMKPVHVARHKAKEEPGLAQMKEAMEDDVNANTLRGEMEKEANQNFARRSDFTTEKRDEVGWRDDEVKFSKQNFILKDRVKKEVLDSTQPKDKNVILISKGESGTEKRNEGRRANEANKFLKQQSMAFEKVKEEVPNSVCSIEAGVYSMENGNVEMIPKDEEICFLSLKNEGNGKHSDVSQVESLKQKSRSREMTHLRAEQGFLSEKENPSSAVKNKIKDGQIGGISAEAPRSSVVSSSASKTEAVIFRNNTPKSKKGDTELRKDTRKNNEIVDNKNRRKKGKELNSKDLAMGISEQGPQAPTTKLKDRSGSNKTSSAAIGGPDLGDLQGVSCMTERFPVDDVPPVENAPVVTLEDWVECDKCHKWRLLPLGMSAGSFTNKKWTCSMLTWLPGMNKCTFSEDETTNALYASYIPLDPASMIQNNQSPYLDANASVTVSASAPNIVLASQAPIFDALPSGGKKKNFVKTEIEAARQSGAQDLHLPVNKDQQRSSEIRNTKNLKKLPRELDSVQKSGNGKTSKIDKKRVADVEAYGASKKIKRMHQQPMKDFDLSDPRVPQDLVKRSAKDSPFKAKDRFQSDMTSKENEIYNVSGMKRKLKDKQQRVNPSVMPSGSEHLVSNWEAGKNSVSERKEKKLKSSNFQARESSEDKGKQSIRIHDAKPNLGGSGNRGQHKAGRSDGIPQEQYLMDRVSRKTPAGRTSSEMALDLGLSDNVTTSSSSKISRKVKSKVHEVKSSPVGSISSSPKKVSKTDPDKGTSKKSLSYSDQLPKAGAESALNELALHNEGYRDRKSNLSRNSGVLSDAADEDQFGKKVSSGRYSHAIDTQPKIEDYKDRGGKADITYEGTSTSQQNLVAESQIIKSPNKLHFDGTNSVKGKSHVSKIDKEKEVSLNLHGVTEFEGGSGSNGGRVEDVNGNSSRQVVPSRVSLRQTQHSGQVPSDIEASSSRNKDSFHRAAKSALREATDLKHSANRLKVAGSGLESTGIFFQAALKFLHGASLLEPGNNQSRSGEMSPNDVYTSTAKLCEYCALEYERCNDMASAALAYKCMEVAYMRVVYCNDLAASRDRQELQMAVRAAPQVESPSSSASDIDNLNQAAIDTVKDGHSAMDHRSHVVSAGNRANFIRLLDFTHDINLAMEASRRSQSAFAAAKPIFTQEGNEHGKISIKSVLDFSFHDVDGLLHLVRLAMESIKS